MEKSVITVNANDSMLDAINLLRQNDILMLPVMKKDKLLVAPILDWGQSFEGIS